MTAPHRRALHIGITGTQRGMLPGQHDAIREILQSYLSDPDGRVVILHHGCCTGVDSQVHRVAYTLDPKALVLKTVLHPPDNTSKMAVDLDPVSVLVTHPPYPYLQRNRHIVAAVDVLIAIPAEDDELVRSGTWSTVRYARKIDCPVVLLTPSSCQHLVPDSKPDSE